jgi:hypothetical protein
MLIYGITKIDYDNNMIIRVLLFISIHSSVGVITNFRYLPTGNELLSRLSALADSSQEVICHDIAALLAARVCNYSAYDILKQKHVESF